ncbi:hypothetical protein PR048_012092 [Dryococelus australis]|uniref:Uncharacterized protein n=1 Tax=Dryococelus australis TaxID=614101 RepID=A0ABQ9HND5_9NEOP|nr:hypothetical protein PR048_012092 [Dryococelus australis]
MVVDQMCVISGANATPALLVAKAITNRGKQTTNEKLSGIERSGSTRPKPSDRKSEEKGKRRKEKKECNRGKVGALRENRISQIAPNLGKSGSNLGGVAPGYSLVGIVLDDSAGQGVFSGISRFPFLSSRHCSILTLMGSKDLAVKGIPNIFTVLHIVRSLAICIINKAIVGATVAERLGCSPLTKEDWVQSPFGSLPDFRMWEYCQTMPLIREFSRGSPVYPTLTFGVAPFSPHFTPMNSPDPPC